MKNIPKLRFPEFNEEWEDNNLKDITTLLKDGTHGTHKDVENGPWLLSAKNIKNNTINISDEDRKISITDYNKIYKNYTLEREDILLSIVGTIGRVSMVKNPVNIAFQRSVAIIRFSKPLESKFFLYLFGTKEFKKKLYRNQVISAQPGIYLGDLAKFNIIYPLIIEEQQKIGNFFSKLDRQIELEEQKLAKLEEQKKGYMQKIFSQELRFKDGNGNNYSEWIKTNLKFLVSYKNGKGYEKEVVQNGKYNIINLNSISTKGMLKDSGKYTDFEDITLKKNDLIMILSDIAKGNLIGKTAIIDQDDKYLLNQRVASLRIKDESTSNVLFIYYFINYFRQYFINMSTGMSQLNINKSTVEDFLIYLPYIEEQDKIGNFFSNLDKSIIKQLDKIELLKERKKGFLQKMFV